jgi:hypothetical protein
VTDDAPPKQNGAPKYVPTERQLALFRAMEDIHDLTSAITVLLVDEHGTLVAVSGDENDVPPVLRKALSGKRLAAAGSVVELLSSIGDLGSTLNVSIYDVDCQHVLAIVFDADADLSTVQTVGREARDMLAEILKAPL